MTACFVRLDEFHHGEKLYCEIDIGTPLRRLCLTKSTEDSNKAYLAGMDAEGLPAPLWGFGIGEGSGEIKTIHQCTHSGIYLTNSYVVYYGGQPVWTFGGMED